MSPVGAIHGPCDGSQLVGFNPGHPRKNLWIQGFWTFPFLARLCVSFTRNIDSTLPKVQGKKLGECVRKGSGVQKLKKGWFHSIWSVFGQKTSPLPRVVRRIFGEPSRDLPRWFSEAKNHVCWIISRFYEMVGRWTFAEPPRIMPFLEKRSANHLVISGEISRCFTEYSPTNVEWTRQNIAKIYQEVGSEYERSTRC